MEDKITKVLIIDDEAEIRNVLQRVISREAGYQVFVAENFDVGLKTVKTEGIDIVISDILMDGKDGLAVAQAVKEYNDNIPVILMTGNPQLTSAEEAVRKRACDYISKPVQRSTILQVLRNAKTEKESRDEHLQEFRDSESERFFLRNRNRDLSERGATILNATSDCVITLGTDLRIRGVNQAVENQFGYAQGELLGQHIGVLVPEDKKEIYLHNMQEMLKRLKNSANEPMRFNNAQLKSATGEVRTYDVSVCEYEFGGERLVTGIARDITQKLLISEKLIDAERRAFLTTLASSIGHEINNSLTAIQAYIEVAHLPNAKEDVKTKAIEITYNQIQKLKNLTSNLLQLGKPGSIHKKLDTLDLNEIMKSVIEVFTKTSRLKYCTLELNTFEKPLMVSTNFDQVSLLFSNLILNAADATSNKGLIRIDVKEDKGSPIVAISDNGIGMTEETIKMIYQPYFTTKKLGQGTGLGMFVVKEIADLFQIKIRVDSKPNEGTTFILTFPKAT